MAAWKVTLCYRARGARERMERTFEQSEIFVGRSATTADLVFPSGNVAKRHVRLHVDDTGRVLASDMQSANGTWLNGVRISTDAPFHPGDELFVGDYVVTLARSPERV